MNCPSFDPPRRLSITPCKTHDAPPPSQLQPNDNLHRLQAPIFNVVRNAAHVRRRNQLTGPDSFVLKPPSLGCGSLSTAGFGAPFVPFFVGGQPLG